MSLTACFSGPERLRAKAELALEDVERVGLLPSEHWAQMNWAGRLTATRSGDDPKEPHGFTALIAADMDALNAAVKAVARHKWVLRTHHETPPKPEPSPEQSLAATVAEMQAEIAALKARLGG